MIREFDITGAFGSQQQLRSPAVSIV